MEHTEVHGDAGSPIRRRRPRVGWIVAAAVLLVSAACARDESGTTATGGESSEKEAAALATVTEDALPAGFEAAPTATVDGQQMKFDAIPGHYWKVIDDNFAIGLHFQSEKPFKWARDAGDNELLYIVYAVPGSCKGLNFQAGLAAADATAVGKPLPGFDHWHGLVGDKGAGDRGHWLMHIPVRNFTFAGMEGNPFEGKQITSGEPGFIPVCEPAMAENPAMQGMMGGNR
jgi:hypothetical protein